MNFSWLPGRVLSRSTLNSIFIRAIFNSGWFPSALPGPSTSSSSIWVLAFPSDINSVIGISKGTLRSCISSSSVWFHWTRSDTLKRSGARYLPRISSTSFFNCCSKITVCSANCLEVASCNGIAMTKFGLSMG